MRNFTAWKKSKQQQQKWLRPEWTYLSKNSLSSRFANKPSPLDVLLLYRNIVNSLKIANNNNCTPATWQSHNELGHIINATPKAIYNGDSRQPLQIWNSDQQFVHFDGESLLNWRIKQR